MGDEEISTKLRLILHNRYNVLAALESTPRTKPQLVDSVDTSRSTIDRAVSDLLENELIEQVGSSYQLTLMGRISLTEHRRYKRTMDGIDMATDVLNAIANDVNIDPTFLDGVDVRPADPHVPESALEESISQIESANRLIGLAPVVLSLYTDVLTQFVENPDFFSEIILHQNTLDSLLNYYKSQFSSMEKTNQFTFYVTEQDLPYALWITGVEEYSVAGITVHEKGGVRGVLMNDNPEAVDWARKKYEQYREQAEQITIDLTE